MILNLRGHHLICLNFFQGKGYDEIFIKNLEKCLNEIQKKEIKIIKGPDDVCKSCPHLKKNRCKYKKGIDKNIRKQDEMALRLLAIKEGDLIKWEDVKQKLPEIFLKWYENYCYNCHWLEVCRNHPYFQILKNKKIVGGEL